MLEFYIYLPLFMLFTALYDMRSDIHGNMGTRKDIKWIPNLTVGLAIYSVSAFGHGEWIYGVCCLAVVMASVFGMIIMLLNKNKSN